MPALRSLVDMTHPKPLNITIVCFPFGQTALLSGSVVLSH